MIAAAQPGRKAYLPALEPLNCDIIVPRFGRFTEQKARFQNKLWRFTGSADRCQGRKP